MQVLTPWRDTMGNNSPPGTVITQVAVPVPIQGHGGIAGVWTRTWTAFTVAVTIMASNGGSTEGQIQWKRRQWCWSVIDNIAKWKDRLCSVPNIYLCGYIIFTVGLKRPHLLWQFNMNGVYGRVTILTSNSPIAPARGRGLLILKNGAIWWYLPYLKYTIWLYSSPIYINVSIYHHLL